ncbi:MAG: PDZ domain-containing protein [Chloroflexota bacterium]
MMRQPFNRNLLSRNLFGRCVVMLLVALLLVNSVSAQDSAVPAPNPTARDPQALAERYLGYTGAVITPPLTPTYKPGDQTQFWVTKDDTTAPVRINATLVADSPNVYLWLEDGIKPSGNLAKAVLYLSQVATALRTRDNFRQGVNAPGIGTLTDKDDLLSLPDVDNDPHLFILYGANLAVTLGASVNLLDSLPVEYAPYSNQHEMIYVNTTSFPDGTSLDDSSFIGVLTRAVYRWIINYNVPTQATWLTETLNWWLFLQFQQTKIDDDSLTQYLQASDTPLNFAYPQAATVAVQQLFLGYFLQRYGSAPFLDLFLQPGKGMSALDTVLSDHQITDPVTGAPVTGRAAFADFVLANGLNFAFGDGRYVESAVPLPNNASAAGAVLDPQTPLPNLSVNQFGAEYLRYTNAGTQPETVSLSFTGSPTVKRLLMPKSSDPTNSFYWSGSDANADATLTRTVDLSAVSKATLTFDAWYEFSSDWNYGYVSISTDDGKTWKPLSASSSTVSNAHGASYGPGFTEISNPAKPHPFPTMGVIIDSDGITIRDVAADSAGAKAGIQTGDQIIGYDHHEWRDTPDVIGLLENYSPGDTLQLYIQRAQERLDVPVVLGAHPTRVYVPPPSWLPQTVDVTPYAGKVVQLRFEEIMLAGFEDGGFAVDNLAIPEIGWTDDASGDLSGWTVSGWQQINNLLPQYWIVQAATSGTQTTYPHVQMLINSSPDERADVVSNGEWHFTLQAGETITFAIAAANDNTSERATYDLGFKKES